MEAFKERWNREIKPYIHNPADRAISEYWWREALKWFYTKLGYSEEHEKLKDVIEEELRE